MIFRGPRPGSYPSFKASLVGAWLLCLWPVLPVWAAASMLEPAACDSASCGPTCKSHSHDSDAEETQGEVKVASQVRSSLTAGGAYRVEIESDPDPIPLNEMFSLHFRVTRGDDPDQPISGAIVTATAWMPEHQHGTNLKPRVTSHGDGSATGVGFLWHMEGKWELKVGVASEGKMEWAIFPFDLEP